MEYFISLRLLACLVGVCIRVSAFSACVCLIVYTLDSNKRGMYPHTHRNPLAVSVKINMIPLFSCSMSKLVLTHSEDIDQDGLILYARLISTVMDII